MFYFYAGVIIFYILGIYIYIYEQTTANLGGFLDMSFSSEISDREVTPKDVRKASIWPILLLIWILKSTLWILNDFACIFLYAFNFDYKKTRLYKLINRVSLWGSSNEI